MALVKGCDPEGKMQVLRMFRLLRPLHSLRFFKGIKTMLAAMDYARGQIVTVIMMVFLFFVIFGSFGIELFKGVLTRTCDLQHPMFFAQDSLLTNVGQLNRTAILQSAVASVQCPSTLGCEKRWVDDPARWSRNSCWQVEDTFASTHERQSAVSVIGFDSMPHALLTLFIMTTLDEWPACLLYTSPSPRDS